MKSSFLLFYSIKMIAICQPHMKIKVNILF